MGKKTATTAAPAKAKAKTGTATVAKPKVDTKVSKAKAIFDESYGVVKRHEVIVRLTTEAGLTHNGASTYYQKMKKAADTATATKNLGLQPSA